LGVYPEFKASLNLKWDRPEADKPVNLGYIMKTGAFWFDAAAWFAPQELALAYVIECCFGIRGRTSSVFQIPELDTV
jgi:hypothetical protein